MSEPLVRMVGIAKSFSGVKALQGVDFTIHAGRINALMGENGAGKSTLIKVLGGVHRPDAGEIFVDGRAVEIANPIAATRLGISIVHQELMLIPELTVAENIFMAREPISSGLINFKQMRQDAQQLLAELDLDVDPSVPVRTLSVAQQQVVEIARALSTQARVLVLDEPTSALSERESERLFELLERLRARGLGIVYISHRMPEVMRLADDFTVLRDGTLAGTLKRAEASPEALVRLMVGRDLPPTEPRAGKCGEPLLEVRNLQPVGSAHPVSFTLHRGEILGLAGLMGAGRTEVARAIFGADPGASGEILLDGKPVKIRNPRAAIRLGIGFVPEDRKLQALMRALSVKTNITVSGLYRRRFGLRSLAEEKQTAEQCVQRLRVRTPSLQQEVGNLSGGNQQKVVIARWLSLSPRVLIVDEPTRGVDVAAKAEIHNLLRSLADEGVGILVISSELPEVLAISDRILVLHEGELTGEFDRSEATEERIMGCATGTLQWPPTDAGSSAEAPSLDGRSNRT